MKKFLLILLSLVMCVSVCACGGEDDSALSHTPVRNESVNINATDNQSSADDTIQRNPMPAYEKLGVNNHIATSDGRYIYYVYSDDNVRYLCRTDMNGENEELLVSEDDPYDIHIDDGYIYVTRGADIYRYDISNSPNFFSSGEHIIGRQTHGTYFVYHSDFDDEYIYFYSGGVYRVKKDKTGYEKIVENIDFTIDNLDIVNGKLYVLISEYHGGLYRMDLDGENMTMIKENIKDYLIYDGAIYTTDTVREGTNLVKTDLNGENSQVVGLLSEAFTATLLNVVNDIFIYRSIEENEFVLCAYNIKTGENKTICKLDDNRIGDVSVVGDTLFVKYSYQGGRMFKVNMDGTGYKQLENPNVE